MADVDLTIEAIDKTGDTLSNIERELLNVNEVVQRQVDSFERVEKQFMEFQESITKNLPFFLTAFGELGTNIKGVTTALKDAQKAQKNYNTEAKKTSGGGERGFGDGEGKVAAPDEKAYTEYLKSQMKAAGDTAVDLQEETHRRMLSNEKNHSDAMQSVIKEDTKEYVSEIQRRYDGSNAVMSESHNKDMRRLQQENDEKFHSEKESNNRELAERQHSRESLEDIDKQYNKVELSEYDRQTKLVIDETKRQGDLKVKAAEDASNEYIQIINNSLRNEVVARKNSHDKIVADLNTFSDQEVEKTNAKYNEMLMADKSYRANKERELKLRHDLELAQVDQTDEALVEQTKQVHAQEKAAQDSHLTERTKSIESAKERDLSLIKQHLDQVVTEESTTRDKDIADQKASHSQQYRNEKEHQEKMVALSKSERRGEVSGITHTRALGREDILDRQARDELSKRDAEAEEKERQENLKRLMDQAKAEEREYADTMKQVKEAVLATRKEAAKKEAAEEKERQENLKRLMDQAKAEEREYADTMKQVKEAVLATRKEAAKKEAAEEKKKQENLKRLMDQAKAEEREYADTMKQVKEAVLATRKEAAKKEAAEEKEKEQNLKRLMDQAKAEEREYADTMKQVKEAVLATRKEAAKKEAAEEKKKQENLKRLMDQAKAEEREYADTMKQVKEAVLATRKEAAKKEAAAEKRDIGLISIDTKSIKESRAAGSDKYLSEQKSAHKEAIENEKRFTDELVDEYKRSAKEHESIIDQDIQTFNNSQKRKSEIAELNARHLADSTYAQLMRKQQRESELIKSGGAYNLSQLEKNQLIESEQLEEASAKRLDEISHGYDKEALLHKQGSEHKLAIIEHDKNESIRARKEQTTAELAETERSVRANISASERLLEQESANQKSHRKKETSRLQAHHQRELNEIDSSDKKKIKLREKSQAIEMAGLIDNLDRRETESLNYLQKELGNLKSYLRVVRAEKESERDSDISGINKHFNKVENEQEAHGKRILNEIQESKKRELSEKDHYNKKAEVMMRKRHKEEIEAEEHKNRLIVEKTEKLGKRLTEKFKGTGLGRTLGVINRAITGAMTADFAMVGAFEIWDFAQSVKDAVVELEGMKLSLTAVEGSAQKAYDQLDRIRDIAKLPGVYLESAIKATTTLRALKLEAELTERTIVTIGNALATLGRETELGGVVLALSQIIGKGKVHAEEINQIAERLPLIRGILVEQFGTANTEILQRMEISIEDFVRKITEGLENLPKVATTIGTQLKNMQNQWFMFKANLGTLLKPGIMSAISGITRLLDTGNALLDRLNESKKREIIGEDREKRGREYVRDFQIATRSHFDTETILKGYNESSVFIGDQMKKVSEEMQQYRQSDMDVPRDLVDAYYGYSSDLTTISRKMRVLERRIVETTKNLDELSPEKLKDIIDILEDKQSDLVLKDTKSSQFELKNVDAAIAHYYGLLDQALLRQAKKGKPDESLNVALAKLVDDKVREYVGNVGRDRITNREESALRGKVKSDYSTEFDQLEGGRELQLANMLSERNKVTEDAIEKLADDVQEDRSKIAKIFFSKEYDDLYKKTKQKAGTEKGKEDVAQAQRDLIALEEKAIGMMMNAGKKLILEKSKLEQEIIKSALEFERRYSEVLQQREDNLIAKFAKQFYLPDVETGAQFGLSRDDTTLPRNQSELKQWISQEMPKVLEQIPVEFQSRFRDEIIKSTNNFAKSLETAATADTSIDKARGTLQREDLAKRQSEIQIMIDSLKPEEGVEQTPQQLQASISALEDAKLLEKFQAYPELQKQFDNEIKTLNKQKINTEKDIIKSQQSFLRIYLDTLKKGADVAYREISEIERSLAEVRSIIDSYDADYGKDISSQQMIDDKKVARRTEDNLVKELNRTRKHEYTQQINEIKNLVDQQQIGQTLSLEDIDKYKSQLKEIDAAAQQHGITIESITTELESLGKQENSIRRQMIKEMLKILNSFEMVSAPVQSTLDVLSSVDLSKLTPEELESTVSQVQDLVKKDKENTQNMVRVLSESWSQVPVGWENEGLRGATSPFMDSTGEASRAMIDQMNAFNMSNISTAIPEDIPREEFFALPEQTQLDLMKFNQERISADQQIQDQALSTASNMISAWENVAASTDTMVDNVVIAAAQIAIDMTQMILSIQTASAAATAAGTGGSALGKFAKYGGYAALAIGAVATAKSFIDQYGESKDKRNSLSGRRPTSLARR